MAELYIPEGLELTEVRAGTSIRRRWFTWYAIPLALFAVLWESLMFNFYSLLWQDGHPGPPTFFYFFPLGHVAVGLGLSYYALTLFFNTTEILISDEGVRVGSGPLPWLDQKEVPAGDLRAVLVRQRVAGGRRGWNHPGQISYTVMYVDPSRHERKLLAGLPHEEQAEFIAASIRQRLRLG